MSDLRPPAACYRLLVSIIAAVQSWSRLTDAILVYPNDAKDGTSLCEHAGVTRRHAQDGLMYLAQNGAIIFRPASGRGRVSTIGLPAEGEHGYYLPHEKRTATVPLSESEKSSAEAPLSRKGAPNTDERSTALALKEHQIGAPPEKTSEELPRKSLSPQESAASLAATPPPLEVKSGLWTGADGDSEPPDTQECQPDPAAAQAILDSLHRTHLSGLPEVGPGLCGDCGRDVPVRFQLRRLDLCPGCTRMRQRAAVES
jgi:hypothetical protein